MTRPLMRGARHGVCYRCYRRHARRSRRRWPDMEIAPYRAANRHLVEIAPRDESHSPAAVRLYRELVRRGACETWIVATVNELAETLGYTSSNLYKLLPRMVPHYVEMRHVIRGIPAWRIVPQQQPHTGEE